MTSRAEDLICIVQSESSVKYSIANGARQTIRMVTVAQRHNHFSRNSAMAHTTFFQLLRTAALAQRTFAAVEEHSSGEEFSQS